MKNQLKTYEEHVSHAKRFANRSDYDSGKHPQGYYGNVTLIKRRWPDNDFRQDVGWKRVSTFLRLPQGVITDAIVTHYRNLPKKDTFCVQEAVKTLRVTQITNASGTLRKLERLGLLEQVGVMRLTKAGRPSILYSRTEKSFVQVGKGLFRIV